MGMRHAPTISQKAVYKTYTNAYYTPCVLRAAFLALWGCIAEARLVAQNEIIKPNATNDLLIRFRRLP